MNPNSESVTTSQGTRRPSNFWLISVAAFFIIVPFLTWYLTWFGRNLTDDEIANYLSDEKNPRHIQQALSQIETRIEKSDSSVTKFYPQIVVASKSPTAEIRKTAAWVIAQDNSAPEFHQALVGLLADPGPLGGRS